MRGLDVLNDSESLVLLGVLATVQNERGLELVKESKRDVENYVCTPGWYKKHGISRLLT